MLADCDSIKTVKELKFNLLGLLELKDDATNAEIVKFFKGIICDFLLDY